MFGISIAVAKKNRLIIKRAYPWSFMWSRVSGAFFALAVPIMLYYFVFGQTVSEDFKAFADGSDYLNYIVWGAAMNVLSFSTLMNVGRCLITELREGTLDNFLISPASRAGYYLGTYAEQLLRSLLEALLIIIFGFIAGARFAPENIPEVFVCIIISSMAFFSLSILVSTIMVYTRDTYLVQNTIFLCMSCICEVAFPIEFLPGWVGRIANIFPLTPALTITRACLSGTFSLEDYRNEMIRIIVLSMVYFLTGYFGFIKYEKKLIEEVLA